MKKLKAELLNTIINKLNKNLKTKFFFDTEFIEYPYTIDLISIGIVAEDGRELYLINSECDLSKASKWVKENVLEQMPEYDKKLKKFKFDAKVMSKKKIKEFILEFVGKKDPEFWAYYGDYDWVVFCWLFGTMEDLPESWPKLCMDLKQEIIILGNPEVSPDPEGEHNALIDAKWLRDAYKMLENKGLIK